MKAPKHTLRGKRLKRLIIETGWQTGCGKGCLVEYRRKPATTIAEALRIN
jgi:hypothetical protein